MGIIDKMHVLSTWCIGRLLKVTGGWWVRIIGLLILISRNITLKSGLLIRNPVQSIHFNSLWSLKVCTMIGLKGFQVRYIPFQSKGLNRILELKWVKMGPIWVKMTHFRSILANFTSFWPHFGSKTLFLGPFWNFSKSQLRAQNGSSLKLRLLVWILNYWHHIPILSNRNFFQLKISIF